MKNGHHVAWLPMRPEFTITRTGSTDNGRCYHETFYEVISRVEMKKEDFARLDACGLLGFGQAYNVKTLEKVVDLVPPVVVDERECPVPGETPMNEYTGQPITNTVPYDYHKYAVRRICDSGD
jgi:hypothetical protein